MSIPCCITVLLFRCHCSTVFIVLFFNVLLHVTLLSAPGLHCRAALYKFIYCNCNGNLFGSLVGHKYYIQAYTMTATNHDGHKPWHWWAQGRQWRPQTTTATAMMATNYDNDSHSSDVIRECKLGVNGYPLCRYMSVSLTSIHHNLPLMNLNDWMHWMYPLVSMLGPAQC